MLSTRSSGILLHPTSLPSPYGIGDLGPEAIRFVDFLADSGQQLWQVLPLGPTGYLDSPYMCFSAMAGNPLLISLDILKEDGFLEQSDLESVQPYPLTIDYGRVIREKIPLLTKAWSNFRKRASGVQTAKFGKFCEDASPWLEDFALFMALKDHYQGEPWVKWDASLITRQPQALKRARREYAQTIEIHKFLQYEFHRQISALRDYANQKHINIIGDLPIYVAHDSAEVWANPGIFQMDPNTGMPHFVAGVPPDYFSETGQLWGNPLYNWDRLEQEEFSWWVERFRVLLEYVNIVRIDHFRGFEAYWSIKYGEPTAINGKWIKAPGQALFQRLRTELGELPIIAEDLGVITPEVDALRHSFSLPGMKILQFAFGSGSDNPYLPHNYDTDCVVYTGTHDNDTTRGWYGALGEKERTHLCRYLGHEIGDNIHWDMARLAFLSVAKTAILPMQDILGLGSRARMNTPSTSGGNWSWRFEWDLLSDDIQKQLLMLTETYGRISKRQS